MLPAYLSEKTDRHYRRPVGRSGPPPAPRWWRGARLVLVVGLLLAVRTWALEPVLVPTASMAPTLWPGELSFLALPVATVSAHAGLLGGSVVGGDDHPESGVVPFRVARSAVTPDGTGSGGGAAVAAAALADAGPGGGFPVGWLWFGGLLVCLSVLRLLQRHRVAVGADR